ncbi:unnamed protein product [Adineta steineri]|uniref:CUE domain-containing protein n=1 Tax=Adineta steineri TaxID=433720 RepID=A0A818U6C1_9BILA|nr:unnamed protein product [Adineta steineri]CAF3688725.1 unnamed protein product [Adineta steineri]
MPRKNAMRDNVSAVRSRLPHLSNLPREKIELALLYYESNVDETVEAFKRNGAVEALSGWTEMNNGRGNNSIKRTNNKNKSSSQTPPSNGILRPSQRVSNIFQTFAEGGIPTIATNGNTILLNTATYSPSSMSSSSLLEQSNNFQSYLSTDLSFHPYLSQDSTNNSESLLNVIESTQNEYNDTSNATTNSSSTTDDSSLLTNHIDQDITNETNGKLKRRKNTRNHNGSTTSDHELTQQSLSNDIHQTENTTTVTKPSFTSNNRKILTKSTKDLQRQTSTLTNVELSFENEIKSSIKRIDDVFKQIRDIIREREVELYLEMDKVKEQGLNIIHRRQQRAIELRQRIDSCDRLESLEIDNLRTDIKQFVTDRRYDLCEELTSSHRFEYDQALMDGLKNFGTVLRIDRKYDRARTLSTSSALIEQNGTTNTNEINLPEKLIENKQISLTNGHTSSPPNHQQPLPQRINNKQNFNRNNAGDYSQNSYVSPQKNGYHQYYEDSNNNYQTVNRRRPPPSQQQQQQQYPQYQNGNTRRPRAIPPSNNTNTNNNNNRRNGLNNSETTNTYRRPRQQQQQPPLQTIISPISN